LKGLHEMSIDNLTVALSGAIPGAVALAIIGFGWGGWVTSGTADAISKTRSEAAVVAALAPICVDQYQRSPSGAAQQAVLDEEGRGAVRRQVESGGWARMPGSTTARPGVAQACADLILKMS
jgi:hypothetical protein